MISNILLRFLQLTILSLMFSCTFEANIDYEITNNTSEIIDLIVIHNQNFKDTIRLEIDESNVFFQYSDSGGSNTVGKMNKLDSIIVVEDIQIISISGKTNINDLTVLNEWELTIPETVSGHGVGFIRKFITDEDLE